MAIKHGKTQKTFVKVFHLNIEEVENVLNKWIKENEDAVEIVDAKLSLDNQNKAIVMAICQPL